MGRNLITSCDELLNWPRLEHLIQAGQFRFYQINFPLTVEMVSGVHISKKEFLLIIRDVDSFSLHAFAAISRSTWQLGSRAS